MLWKEEKEQWPEGAWEGRSGAGRGQVAVLGGRVREGLIGKGRFEQRLTGDEGISRVRVPAGGEEHPVQRQQLTCRASCPWHY